MKTTLTRRPTLALIVPAAIVLVHILSFNGCSTPKTKAIADDNRLNKHFTAYHNTVGNNKVGL